MYFVRVANKPHSSSSSEDAHLRVSVEGGAHACLRLPTGARHDPAGGATATRR